MLMVMDAGNSRLKWATVKSIKEGGLSDIAAETYHDKDKETVINEILSREHPSGLLLVHVLGAVFESSVREHCLKLAIELELASTSANSCGITNAYEIPEDLGADRFVGLIAAHHTFPADPVIVIDAGTAVTIDAIDNKGQHLGGLIIPGLQLWSDTLIKNTQLQHIPVEQGLDVFATSTRKGIDNGSLIGLAGAILHVCQSMEQKLKQPVRRILCGGDSRKLSDYFNTINALSVKRASAKKGGLANKSALAKKSAPATKNTPAVFTLMPDLVITGLTVIGKIGSMRGKNA